MVQISAFRCRGFTLVETIVSLFILAMVAGIMVALFQPILFAPEVSSRLQALYLAQEGVEIARNVRDTNFAKIAVAQSVNWLDGMTDCQTGCEAEYQSGQLEPDQNRFVHLNADGLYTYDVSGTPTTFQRTISVIPEGDPLLATKAEVLVEVSWAVKGRTHAVEVSTEIYNWLEFES